MADKSPRQALTKKSTKNIKDKRADKKQRADQDRLATRPVSGR